jgi:hypothetical protein
MSQRHLRGLLGLLLVAACAAACGGSLEQRATGGTGGGAGLGGIAGAGGVVGEGGSGAGGAPAACVETPQPLHGSGTILELTIDPVLGGQPFVYGEPNVSPGGDTITPVNFRFYVSEVRLLSPAGAVVVDLVTAAGVPEPYGVHLFNHEDASSHTLRVLALSGTYNGVEFRLGLTDACNTSSFAARNPPLSDTSQMTWPPPFGYLFLRYESLLAPGDAGAAAPPRAIHMGGLPGMLFAPSVRVVGALSVPAGQTVTRSVQVVMDQIFVGTSTPADLTGLTLPPGDEVAAGERLRRSALAGLPLFTFGP